MVLTSSTALLLLSLNTAILLCFFLEKSGFLAGSLCCLSTCYLFKYMRNAFPSHITVRNRFLLLITVRNTFSLVTTVENTFPSLITVSNTFPLVITVENTFPLVITVGNTFPLVITVENAFPLLITVVKNNGSSFYSKKTWHIWNIIYGLS